MSGQRLAEACVAPPDDGVGTISHLELTEDIGDVIAHRLWAEDKAIGDLRVARALGDEVENLALAVAQLRKGLLWHRGVGAEKKSMSRTAMAGLKIASPLPTERTARSMSSGLAPFTT